MESGTVVEYIDQQQIVISAVLDTKQKRLRLLTESNREVTMSEGRISHASQLRINVNVGRDAIIDALKQTALRREQLKEKINIRELWELLNEEHEWIDLKTMTEYCFSGPVTSDHESAVIRSFFENRMYFKFNNNQFFPNSEKQVEQILAQKKEEERRQKLIEKGGDWLKNAFKVPHSSVPEEMQEVVTIVKSYYLFEKESKTSDIGRAILARAGIDLNDQIFKFFTKIGIWNENENLDLLRMDIPRDFSKKVEDYIIGIKAPENMDAFGQHRKDLTSLDIITIDGESTKDFDDALSIEKENDHYILGVHIIDVDHYVKKGDILDQCGLNRGSSIYMPDLTVPMLPPILSENICSLKKKEIRPAISTMVRLNRFFEIIDSEIVPSVIQVKRQLNYDETCQMIETDEDIKTLYLCAKAFRESRMKAGAIQITLPDITISFTENNTVNVSSNGQESPSRMLVSELMIMANSISGKFLADHSVPAIFRAQPEPKARLYHGESDSLFLNYMQRKQVSRVIIGFEPEYHSGLGVHAYVTCTSPIRRYFDLVTQRQLKSILGMDVPYTREEIMLVYQTLEQPLANVGKAQYMRHRYWLLKYLEGQKGQKTDAIVVDKRKDAYFVLLHDYMIECKLSGRGLKMKPQDLIQIVIQHADARKELLSVFPG